MAEPSRSLSTRVAGKTSELASSLQQHPSLSYLAYPTSIIGNLGSAVIGTLGCLAGGTYETAQHLITHKKLPSSLPPSLANGFTPVAAKFEMTLSRSLQPYPYTSIQKLVNYLIDFSTQKAKELNDTSKTIAEIESSALFPDAVKWISNNISKRYPHLETLAKNDIIYCSRNNKSQLKDFELINRLVAICNEDLSSYEAVFRELLLNVILSLRNDKFDLPTEVCFSIGKLLLSPQERCYMSSLESLIENDVKKLSSDERAMRVLGNGDPNTGYAKMAQPDDSTLLFVAVYCTITELQDVTLNCPYKSRKDNLDQAKTALELFLNGACLKATDDADGKLNLTKDISQSRGESPEIFFLIRKIARNAFNGDSLRLHYFDLMTAGKTMGIENRYLRAWNRAIMLNPKKI